MSLTRTWLAGLRTNPCIGRTAPSSETLKKGLNTILNNIYATYNISRVVNEKVMLLTLNTTQIYYLIIFNVFLRSSYINSLSGEHPAAMQQGSAKSCLDFSVTIYFSILILYTIFFSDHLQFGT